MSDKFKNKYRIKSARHPNWDYGSNAAYFITIATQNRNHYFGEIICSTNISAEETQNLTSSVETQNLISTVETQNFASLSVVNNLSEIGKVAHQNWLSIPDHFPFVKLGNHIIMPNHVHGILIIEKGEEGKSNFALKPNKFGPQSQNIASIMRGYKASVKKYATIHKIDFSWQPKYHDRIIRDERAYQNISKYITNNPKKWAEKDPS